MTDVDHTFTLRARLDQFFPPEHPDTPWLVRLAVLRDDASYEGERLGLKPEDSPDEVWRCAYTLRKLTITIGEVKNLLAHDARESLKRRSALMSPTFLEAVENTVQAIEVAAAAVKPLRDGLGAHVRPSNAMEDNRDPTPDVIRLHGATEFNLTLDMHNGRSTSFREMTVSALLFAWPDVVDVPHLERRHGELASTVIPSLHRMFHAIDMLLYLHWESLKIPMTPVSVP
jgi:hypothetical protein